jgi:hypothetical protein
LINKTADCLLGDFGAASFYDLNSGLGHCIERVEVSAFGCLLEDVLNLVPEKEINNNARNMWLNLITDCRVADVKSRLSFSQVSEVLNKF